jgi:hypothetical protein
MLRDNELFNEIMVLPPKKRNIILKILDFKKERLIHHPCCQHDSRNFRFFYYAVKGIKYHCDYDTTLNFYLEYLDDKIREWKINNGRIPEPELEKERVIVAFHDVQEDMMDIGWDGDYSQQPSVLFLPCPESESFEMGFVWKQRRDDLTFIASPVPLLWLGEAKIKKGSPRCVKVTNHAGISSGMGKGEV